MAKGKRFDTKHSPLVLPGLSPQPVTPVCTGWQCCGIDEAGRGCLAGPVVACAVSLPDNWHLPGLDDSKKLSPGKREILAQQIRAQALGFGLGIVWPGRIDAINILQATYEAMAKALLSLARVHGRNHGTMPRLPELALIDGNHVIPSDVLARVLLPALSALTKPADPPERALAATGFRQRCLVGGDAIVPAISAASIIAKVWRDHLMTALARRWPNYGFDIHKGYGTAAHLRALREYGPCPMHRLSFRGVVPAAAVKTQSPGTEAMPADICSASLCSSKATR